MLSDDNKKNETAIAVRGSDDYERSHMTPDEGVLYRDKFVSHWSWHAIMGATGLASTLPLLLTPEGAEQWPMILLMAASLAIVWLMFAVLRVSVSSQKVQIQLGLFGPEIPIEQITRAEAVDYDWKTYGGWGIRRGKDGSWAYNMVGDAGRAARIEYTDEKGKERAVLVTSQEPHLLVDAIQQARGVDVNAARDDDEIEDAVLDLGEEGDERDGVIFDVEDDRAEVADEVEEKEEVVEVSGTSSKK